MDGFQSRDETAMLVHKRAANYNESNSQNTFSSMVLCTNMAAVTTGENHLLEQRSQNKQHSLH